MDEETIGKIYRLIEVYTFRRDVCKSVYEKLKEDTDNTSNNKLLGNYEANYYMSRDILNMLNKMFPDLPPVEYAYEVGDTVIVVNTASDIFNTIGRGPFIIKWKTSCYGKPSYSCSCKKDGGIFEIAESDLVKVV